MKNNGELLMNNNHQKKAVFFLGAGFSKAIISGYPTLQGLTQEINKKYIGEKNSVTQHFYDEIPKQYKENIEHLLTFLSSNLPFKTEVQISADDALYKDLRNKIASFFKMMQNINLGSKPELDLFYNYIKLYDIPCITLNYDILLEKIFEIYFKKIHKQLITTYEYFYNCPITSIYNRQPSHSFGFQTFEDDLRYHNEFPVILKLHGSINWLCAGISRTDPVFCIRLPNNAKYEYLIKDLQPMIVPPVMDKTSIYNHMIFRTIWRQAFEKLREAEEIYIWGFSFPETDLSIQFLFQSALEKNENLQRIYFINTERELENKKEHFSKVFAGYENKFKLDFTYCCEDSLNKFITGVIKPQIENK